MDRLWVIVLLLIAFNGKSQNLFINEVVSFNHSKPSSKNGENDDWIEIYNAGDTDINLTGMFLSDDLSDSHKWTFPSRTIYAKSFLIVFASGRDTVFSNTEIHTNFSISNEGEDIFMSDASGVIDFVRVRSLGLNNSFGRQPDGSSALKLFSQTTPGASNNKISFSDYCPAPIFSHNAGFYINSFNLSLNASIGGAQIRYTTDGSDPTSSSPIYTSSIPISDRTSEANRLCLIPTTDSAGWATPAGNIEKSTVIKARLFKSGYLPGPVITNTYFVNSNIRSRFNLPVISISTNENNLFDYNTGIYVPGEKYTIARAADSTQNPYTIAANYNQEGEAWEKPCHVEFFGKDGTLGFSLDMSVDIHGKNSRYNRQKSLNLKFNSDYNSEKNIKYEIFHGLRKNGNGDPLIKFNSLVLRSGATDWGRSYIRDELTHFLVSDTKMDVQSYQPAVLFVNGEYWGLHNIREKLDLDYFENHYGLNEDSISIFSMFYYFDEGNKSSLSSIQNIISKTNSIITKDTAFDYLNARMDISNYIDYYITELYCNNTDWPGNNYKYWRSIPKLSDSINSYGNDGRWRWMLMDTDFGFGLGEKYSFNALSMATAAGGTDWPNPDESTWLFRNLLKNNNIRSQFINRYADMLNSNFKEERVNSVIDSFKALIQSEMPFQINRWKAPSALFLWQLEINAMKDFANRRPNYCRSHIQNYFGLNGQVKVNLDVSGDGHGIVKINTLTINENLPGISSSVYPWEGIYFENIAVEVEAIPAPGYKFIGWEGDVSSAEASITLSNNSDSHLTAVFEPLLPTINSVASDYAESAIKLYPNPNAGNFSVQLNDAYVGEVSIKLMDLKSKEFFSGTYLKNGGLFLEQLRLDALPSGIYFVQIQSGESVYTKKLIVSPNGFSNN